MPDADKNHRLQSRRAEFLGNFLRKLRHVVTKPARAERAEVSKVFAKLRGFDAGGFRERLARDRADAVLTEAREAAQINRKTINRLARNFRATILLQSTGKLSKRLF